LKSKLLKLLKLLKFEHFTSKLESQPLIAYLSSEQYPLDWTFSDKKRWC